MAAYDFPNSPSNGDTVTVNAVTYTYSSSKTRWSSAAPSGSSTTVYATIDLLPLSGASTGDQAYVSGNNRLYLWNGTGWYNIALINTTPSISGANASYNLANDGTATTVTITATDPEGIPITFSIASDTSGSIATVSQGTGSNTHVFTITPTTNSANGGSFSLTFRASDGVNIATAVSSFILAFTVINSKYTSLLLTSVGANDAVNNAIDDKSSSNHTITAVGDVHQNTFSPYREGGYSTYFDGAGDYLTIADSAEHDFGTGDFSMEFWWWPETVTGNPSGYHIAISSLSGSGTQIGYDQGTRKLYFYNATNIIQNTSATPNVKAWNHIAVSRSGTTVSLYLNGTRVGTATHSAGVDFSSLSIGRYNNGSYEIDGYLRDVRFVKGTAVYDATQTSLTVPDEPLTAITNTTLLTCHLPYIVDGSTTGHTITVHGNTETKPFGPYDYNAYNSGNNGGSIFFDGTGDYLDLASHANFGFGTGDFTVEFWIYYKAISGYPYPFDFRTTATENKPSLYLKTDSTNQAGYWVNGSNMATGSNNFTLNNWIHYALVRNGTTTKGYFNGTEDFSVSDTVDYGSSSPLQIASAFSNGNFSNASISDFRVVKGTAVYTSAFTPPAAPLTAVTNTSLLLNGTDAGIIDRSQSVKDLVLNGDVSSSTTQAKYLSSSMYFDGVGDFIQIKSQDSTAYGTKDFTIEMWVYISSHPSSPNYRYIIGQGSATSGGNNLGIYIQGNVFKVFSDSVAITGTNSYSLSTWTHIALARNGSTLKLYVDGTEEGSVSNSLNFTSTASGMSVGKWAEIGDNGIFAGYISDLRITKGLARYTSNFTAPSAALGG